MKLLFVNRAVDQVAGGIERFSTNLMNSLVEQQYEVDLFTWDLAGATSFYSLSPKIHWYRLNMGDPAKKAGMALILRRMPVIRSLIKKIEPDIIICFQGGPFISMRLYTCGLGIPVIVAERNAPSRFDHLQSGRWRSLIFQTYRFASRITIQCESYRAQYPSNLHGRIVTIPNPVYPARLQAQPHVSQNGRFQLLSVGRLSYQKNYTTLVRAFASVAKDFPEWDLKIIGDGEELMKLRKLASDSGLAQRIIFAGTTDIVDEAYANAHTFCLSSRWEGFPNALAEALAHGLPAVGFAGCAGIPELIKHGDNGILAAGNGDHAALATVLAAVMKDPELRANMGAKARLSIAGYSPEHIQGLWKQLFNDVIKNTSSSNLCPS